jgi:5-methylcytosine-specific restriction endonuclease McrA
MGTLDHLNLPSEPPAPKQKWADKTTVEAKQEKARAKTRAWIAACAAVTTRDAHQCRICAKRVNAGQGHHHHVTFRSKGGGDETQNLILACPGCHALLHAHKLHVEGNADVALAISRRNLETGEMEVWRQEVSPRVYVGAA